MNTAPIVSKVWSFCTTLRDDGVGYGDYLEQLTYLIFLKMADEYARPPYNRDVGIPEGYGWTSLTVRHGAKLEAHYVVLLRRLGEQRGMLGQIFTKAQNKITDPAKLARLIAMVDGTDWVVLGADVKGDIYEGLLERNAEDTKSGAGQYFTPRALIRAMVACLRPEPGKTIADPACGTGGFFLAAHEFLANPENRALDRDQKAFLKRDTFHGNEIVAGTRRLCLMNMLLHGIGEMTGDAPVSAADALISPPSATFDYVLANPPFGKKSSMSFTNAEGEQETDDLTYNRQDFWATTSNKQLNFVQHIRTMLKTTGRAAVVVPDNVLFEGGAGETVRRKLLQTTDLHTILRLPTGDLLRPGSQGERHLLRQPGGQPGPADTEGLVLRLPHERAPHAQAEAADVRPFARIHRVLQPGEPPCPRGDLERRHPGRPMARLVPRRPSASRQGQPRRVLAEGCIHDRPGEPAGTRSARGGDHGTSPCCARQLRGGEPQIASHGQDKSNGHGPMTVRTPIQIVVSRDSLDRRTDAYVDTLRVAFEGSAGAAGSPSAYLEDAVDMQFPLTWCDTISRCDFVVIPAASPSDRWNGPPRDTGPLHPSGWPVTGDERLGRDLAREGSACHRRRRRDAPGSIRAYCIYDGFQSPATGPASARVSPESHDAIVTISAWS